MDIEKSSYDYKEVQQNIADYINDNGIKQTFISTKTGYPQPKISRLVSGKQEMTLGEFLTFCFVLKSKPTRFL